MFSNQYQGNLSTARSANRAQYHQNTSSRLGPYTKLQSNSLPREPPVNAKENQYEEPQDDIDYSFSHLPVRERKKLFQNGNDSGMNNQRGRQAGFKPRRAYNETQSDFGGEYGRPMMANYQSQGSTLPRTSTSTSRSQGQHQSRSSARIVPQQSRTLDTAAQRLNSLEQNIPDTPTWNTPRPNDMMTQSAYHSSYHHTPVFNRQVNGPATRVVSAKSWQEPRTYQQPQPLKVNVYNSDSFGTSAHHSPMGSTIWHHSRPQQRVSYYQAPRQEQYYHQRSAPSYNYGYQISPSLLPLQSIKIPITPSNSYQHSFHQRSCSYQPAYESQKVYSSPRNPHASYYSSSAHFPCRSNTNPRIHPHTPNSLYIAPNSYSQQHRTQTYHTPVMSHHSAMGHAPQMSHTPGMTHYSGMSQMPGTVSIPARSPSKMQHLSVLNSSSRGPPMYSGHYSRHQTPAPASPTPIRPGGRSFFDEEAGVSEF